MAIENFNLISAKSFNEQNDIENTLLAAIVQNETSGSDAFVLPTSWDDIDNMVDLGIAKKQIKIGDQFSCNHGNNEIIWDVLGHNCETLTDVQFANRDNMTICMHNCFPTQMQFSARQAFYATDEGLPAGTYNILISSTSYAADQGKYAQFTLTQPLPAGGQMVFTHYVAATIFNKTFSTYSSSTSTVAIETPLITEGSNGINLGALTGSQQTNINSNMRADYGTSNYKDSAIRQWLNSDATAGNVWKPTTKFDRPPEWASTADGFMRGLDEDFVKAIKKTHIITARNTAFENGGQDEIDDYFFLLSKPQVYGGGNGVNVNEGNAYPYFENYSSLNAAGSGANNNRIKTRGNSANVWWLRSPSTNFASSIFSIGVDGGIYNYYRMNSKFSVVAACTI